ncbi:hypothetical protein DER46DRAFT_261386 [Fusarium sp. MPI-SDFR-AT-0072]|nr:hypothetical protein DER46DRAFT_261386 [Fusarium sp. MPI-SDFR-AT-0072]
MPMLMPPVDMACESGSPPLPSPTPTQRFPFSNTKTRPRPLMVNLDSQQSESDLPSPGVVLFACIPDTCQHQRHATLGVYHSLLACALFGNPLSRASDEEIHLQWWICDGDAETVLARLGEQVRAPYKRNAITYFDTMPPTHAQ